MSFMPIAPPPLPRVTPDRAFARDLRGFGPLGILSLVVIYAAGDLVFAPLSAMLVLLWAWLSQTPWHELGYVRPKHWASETLSGIVAGIALKFLLKAVIMPLLGAEPMNHAFHFLAGNPAKALVFVFIIIGAGFAEETIFRGFLFERLGKLFGTASASKVLIVLISAGLFGAIHYPDQSVAGVEQGIVVGLVFGTVFAIRPSIWPLMCAHAAFDLTALAMIYFGLETRVAHLILS